MFPESLGQNSQSIPLKQSNTRPTNLLVQPVPKHERPRPVVEDTAEIDDKGVQINLHISKHLSL